MTKRPTYWPSEATRLLIKGRYSQLYDQLVRIFHNPRLAARLTFFVSSFAIGGAVIANHFARILLRRLGVM